MDKMAEETQVMPRTMTHSLGPKELKASLGRVVEAKAIITPVPENLTHTAKTWYKWEACCNHKAVFVINRAFGIWKAFLNMASVYLRTAKISYKKIKSKHLANYSICLLWEIIFRYMVKINSKVHPNSLYLHLFLIGWNKTKINIDFCSTVRTMLSL